MINFALLLPAGSPVAAYLLGTSACLVLALAARAILHRRPATDLNWILRIGIVAFPLALPLLILYDRIPPVGSLVIHLPGSITVGNDAVGSAVLEGSAADLTRIALLLWAAGAVVMLVRLTWAHTAVRRTVRRAATPAFGLGANLSDQSRTSARLLTSEGLSVPFATGLFRPVIILPARILDSPERMQSIVAHEMAHIDRRDLHWSWLANLITALIWWNPLIWICRRKMLADAERACDDRVLLGGVNPESYAEHLLTSVRDAHTSRSLIVLGATFHSHLEGRIMSIISNTHRSVRTRPGLLLASALLLALVVGTAATVRVQSAVIQNGSRGDGAVPLPTKGAKAEAVTEVDQMPEMTYNEPPVYPDSARKAGVSGDVWVKALIGADGAVAEAEVAKGSGDASLDKAALTAAYKNRFKPASAKGKPVAVWITYKVTFTLNDKESDTTR